MSISGPDSPDEQVSRIRIGDAERNAALEALGEHVASGRLDLDEFSTRSAQVASARTVGDLSGLFDDLPGPHPAASAMVAKRPNSKPLRIPTPADDGRSRAQKFAAGVSGAAGLIAVVLFFLLTPYWGEAWLVFLLVPIGYSIAKSAWGPEWRHDPKSSKDQKN